MTAGKGYYTSVSPSVYAAKQFLKPYEPIHKTTLSGPKNRGGMGAMGDIK
jgi:hypothetical protein